MQNTHYARGKKQVVWLVVLVLLLGGWALLAPTPTVWQADGDQPKVGTGG